MSVLNRCGGSGGVSGGESVKDYLAGIAAGMPLLYIFQHLLGYCKG